MNIISPEFSFLDFNYTENDTCDNEYVQSLPVCGDLSIKAQVEMQSDILELETEPYFIGLADSNCNEIYYDENIKVIPFCSTYKFNSYTDTYPVNEDNVYNLCNTDNDTPIETFDFLANPFDLITSADLEFEPIVSYTYASEIQIYINGKGYIFRWASLTSGSNYDALVNDNTTIVKVRTVLNADIRATKLKIAINDLIDSVHGTTTTYDSGTGTITIADVPADSYVKNYGFATGLTTVTPSSFVSSWFYLDNDKLNFNITTELISDDVLFQENTSLTASNSYNFKLYYDSLYTDIDATFTVDDGTNPATVINIAFDSYSGVIDIPYTCLLTTSHTITIELTTYGTHHNGLSFTKLEKYNTVLFNVTLDETGNVPIGLYSKVEILKLISNLLGFTFDCSFVSCCDVVDIAFEITVDGEIEDTVIRFELRKYWNKGFIDFPALPLETIAESCFTYIIMDIDKDIIACSNVFHKETDCCFVSKIEYSNNEDAFGFTYPTGITNSVNLPFFLHSPKYPVNEKIYRQTNGLYRRLSADIEKEYESETDYVDEQFHDKFITALKHDTVIITSNRLGFTEQMSQQGDYSLDWNSKIDFTSKAEFKLRKYFNGKNNNCGQNC